jgi:hypothetical protein
MSETEPGYSRGQFIRNSAKGSLVLVGSAGVVATVAGCGSTTSHHKKTTTSSSKTATTPKKMSSTGLSKSDITVLQTGYIAESLAVMIYTAIVDTYFKKLKLDPGNLSYFQAALADEKAHLAAWKKALGSKYTPTGFTVTVPGKYVASKDALAKTGATLEEAFVSTYLGAIDEFNSSDLKTIAAGVASNEATHYSFFDAILPGANAVLPAFGPKPITAGTAATTLKSLDFLK